MGGKDGDKNIGDWDSYPKKDSGEREWDRSSNPPPPQWETHDRLAEPAYDFRECPVYDTNFAGCLVSFILVAIGNGLIWGFFRVASGVLFPTEPNRWFWIPLTMCMAIFVVVGFIINDGKVQWFGNAEALGVSIGFVVSLALLVLVSLLTWG